MIEPDHPRLSIVRQCELASISRSSFYTAIPCRRWRLAVVLTATGRRTSYQELAARSSGVGSKSKSRRTFALCGCRDPKIDCL
jgi:hypothetical protein